MMSTECENVIALTLADTLPALTRLLSWPGGVTQFRRSLETIRNDLHEACGVFANDSENRVEEQVSDCFVDALAYITDALRTPVIDREMIRQAAASLGCLASVLQV